MDLAKFEGYCVIGEEIDAVAESVRTAKGKGSKLVERVVILCRWKVLGIEESHWASCIKRMWQVKGRVVLEHRGIQRQD